MAAPKLSRDVIVDAAFEVLDEVGIDGLTVRALATKLGVKAPALYWHLANKQALLDEMGTTVASRIQRSLAELGDGATLAEAVRAYAQAARAEYLRHRDGARTFSGTRLTDPELLRDQEAVLARCVEQGYSIEQVTDAFEIVTAWVVGFVIEEQERIQSAEGRYDLAERDAVVGADAPLTSASGHHLYRPADQKFSEQLDLLLPALTSPPLSGPRSHSDGAAPGARRRPAT